jgi:hypothetical protein
MQVTAKPEHSSQGLKSMLAIESSTYAARELHLARFARDMENEKPESV